MNTTLRVHLIFAPAWLVVVPAAFAQDSTAQRLPPIVTITREVGRSPMQLPFSIIVTRPDSSRPGQPHMQLDQTLLVIPGITTANRSNPSQDPRISIRGFGARSAFGVRSIRVLRDGMPLTLPDGQTPVDYLDLETVGSIETIRGTASALYGNASGGVIDIRSASAPAEPFAVQGRGWFGSDQTQRTTALLGGTSGVSYYQASVGRSTTDGYRAYARQRLTNLFARAGTTVRGTELSFLAMGLDMPLAENPGALTLAQWEADPTQADPLSIRRRARKEVQQLQVGVSAMRPLRGSGDISAQLYAGTRSLDNPLTFAIVDVGRRQYGGGARLTTPWRGALGEHRVTIGADVQGLSDERRNFANCNGLAAPTAACPTLGVERGARQLDQREIVTSVGAYVRDELVFRDLTVSGGLRADAVYFTLRDRFTSDGRDDSGARALQAVSPMLGLIGRLGRLHAIYGNLSTAFETPTTTELGNQPDGNAGLNRSLQPQKSTTVEAGVKGLAFDRVYYDVALFTTAVRDELIPFEVPGGQGRTYFRNAGRTRRRGVELFASTEWRWLQASGGYTFSHFRFDDFSSGTNEFGGNRIPGIPQHQIQAAATATVARTFVTAELQTKSRVYANDANSVSIPPFAVVNLRAGASRFLRVPWLTPMVAVQNVLDRRYVGSVALNATGATLADAKFYEPTPGRTWLLGLEISSGR